jgi:hypothetical protein
MALQVEDMDDAFPYRLALENLFDGLGSDQHGLPAVLPFYCLFELVDAHFHGSILARFYRALFPH